jgi:elongation factor Ts
MAEITAALVRELREATNVGMMECKRALVEAEGDKDKAVRILRERGVAIAVKKSSRAANQGVIASAVAAGAKSASLVEVNCETDFVAKNEQFQAFANELAGKALDTGEGLVDAVKDEVVEKITQIGENIVVRRSMKMDAEGVGAVFSYVHLGGKVAVLLELGCENDETTGSDVFTEVGKDLTMHVAACSPLCLKEDEVPADQVAAEREIFAKQVTGKPENIIEKIVDGKMRKYYAEVCLLLQGFVKEPKKSVTALLEEKGKQLGDTLSIRRYVRWQLGE